MGKMKELAIDAMNEVDFGFRAVVLWYAVGLGGQYFGTKEQAEKEVRKAFPDEGEDRRYARVFFKTFYEEV